MAPRRKPPLDLDIEVETPDGFFPLSSTAKKASDRPQGINFSTQRGDGFATGGCTLSRPIFKDFPDVNLLDTWRAVGHNEEIAYEGRLHSDPRTNNPAQQLQIALVGWMTYLKQRKIAPLIIDRRVSGWTEPSTQRRAAVVTAGNRFEGSMSTGWQDEGAKGPGVVLSFTQFDKVWTEVGEAWLYAGGEDIQALRFDFDQFTSGAKDTEWLTNGALCGDDLSTEGTTDKGTDLDNVDAALQTITATATGRKYARLQSSYGGGFEGTGSNVHAFLNPRIIGNHELTARSAEPNEGYYLSDIMEWVLATFFPKLEWAGNTNPFELTQATWHDAPTTGYDLLAQLNQFALWELNVWEERKLHFEQADLTTFDWVISTDEDGVDVVFQGDSIENFANGIAVTYTDVLTERVNVLYPPDHEELRDESEDNPANRHGEANWTDVEVPWPATEAEALQIGRAYLAEYNRPKRPGTFRISGGYIQDYAGHWHQGWKPRCSQTIGIGNLIGDEPRLITSTSWDQDSKTLEISVDNPSQILDAIIARQQVALQSKGLQ